MHTCVHAAVTGPCIERSLKKGVSTHAFSLRESTHLVEGKQQILFVKHYSRGITILKGFRILPDI